MLWIRSLLVWSPVIVSQEIDKQCAHGSEEFDALRSLSV